jgi:DNA (cytosine-5)-methyltransferase 1
MGRIDYESETLIPMTGGGFDVAHALRGEGFDASEDGTGRGTPIVPVAHPLTAGMSASAARMPHEQGALIPVAIQERAVSENPDNGPQGAGFKQDGTAYTLEARNKVQAVAFDCKGTEVQFSTDGTHSTLRSMGHANSHQNAGGHAAVAFDMRGREGGAMMEGPHDTANIRAASGGSSRSYIAQPWAVRRLTPTECERLQGFPDGWTDIPIGNRRAADGPRYKALGNSMAVNAMRWIGMRIQEVENIE